MLSYGFSKFLVLGHGFVLRFVVCLFCVPHVMFFRHV